ncbi:MAG: TerB family tellurite resistance protein [Alphaproteobacteria bacterium]|nr:TerB family tellurite resistance protein [Alphaproteobacteria bacterium]
MPVEKEEILKAAKDFRDEQFEDVLETNQSIPDVVQETLTSSIEIHSGISVKATITYESLSSNLKKRDFLIRRIIKNKEEYFIDGVALDIKAPRFIRVSQISCITDIASGEMYGDPYVFLQNVLGIEIEDSYLPEPMSDFAKAIKETSHEITVLMYLVGLDGKRASKERQCVLKHVRSRVPYLAYDDVQMNDYLISLAPDSDSFSTAFHHILRKGKEVVEPLLQAVLNVITADGEIHDREKAFLARVIDWLKQDGYQIDVIEEK